MLALGAPNCHVRSVTTVRPPCCEKPRPWRMTLHVERAKCQGALRHQTCGWRNHLGRDHLVPTVPVDHVVLRESTPQILPRSLTHKQVNKITWLVQTSVLWGSLLPSTRWLEVEVWVKSTSTSDFTDRSERVEVNTIYHCLQFCCQSVVAWENSELY